MTKYSVLNHLRMIIYHIVLGQLTHDLEKRKKLDPYLTSYTKINFTRIKELILKNILKYLMKT